MLHSRYSQQQTGFTAKAWANLFPCVLPFPSAPALRTTYIPVVAPFVPTSTFAGLKTGKAAIRLRRFSKLSRWPEYSREVSAMHAAMINSKTMRSIQAPVVISLVSILIHGVLLITWSRQEQADFLPREWQLVACAVLLLVAAISTAICWIGSKSRLRASMSLIFCFLFCYLFQGAPHSPTFSSSLALLFFKVPTTLTIWSERVFLFFIFYSSGLSGSATYMLGPAPFLPWILVPC